MTTKEKTIQEQAREVAQELVNKEIDRKAIVNEITELREKFESLIEDGADSSYDVNNGIVFIQETVEYSVPNGLLQEISAKVKNPEKLSQELIEQKFNLNLKPTRKALKELRNSENPDLSSIVVQEEKSKVAIKTN